MLRFPLSESGTILGNTTDKITIIGRGGEQRWRAGCSGLRCRDTNRVSQSTQCVHSCTKCVFTMDATSSFPSTSFPYECIHPTSSPGKHDRARCTHHRVTQTRHRTTDVSPCSRSRWSYHGSSSSVTNSSILPARSIDADELLLLHRRCGLRIHRRLSRKWQQTTAVLPPQVCNPFETNHSRRKIPAAHLLLDPPGQKNEAESKSSDVQGPNSSRRRPPPCFLFVSSVSDVETQAGRLAARSLLPAHRSPLSAQCCCCCCVQVQSEMVH